MKHLLAITPVLLGMLLLPSCVKETSRGDAFEAVFSLDTPTVYDGDSFQLSIRCNRSEFKLLSFECPLLEGLLEPNTTCTVRDGLWSLRTQVHVSRSQRCRMTLSIQDPVTGLVREFSALFEAYSSTGLTLLIENEAIRSAGITASLPTVIGGDDFVFSLHGKAERFIVEAIECEFRDAPLTVGSEVILEDGCATFRIPEVEASDDLSPRTLSLTLLDTETGRDTTLTASYVKASPFRAEVTLAETPLVQGESATVRLTASRSPFLLKEYAGPAWFVLKDCPPEGKRVGLNLEGYAELHTLPMEIDGNGEGVIRFELVDSDYTLRSVILTLPYTAALLTPPRNVFLSGSRFTLSTGETAAVRVTTTTPHSTGLFTARVLSDEGQVTLYAPSAGETTGADEIPAERYGAQCTITDGRLYLRGMEGRWGKVTIRVAAKGDERFYSDLRVVVRRDVALRLKGDFHEYIHPNPDAIEAVFSDVGGIGWHGFPRSLEAELVSLENRSGRALESLTKEEVSTYVRSFSLGDGNASLLSVKFVLSAGNKVTSDFFYAAYQGYKEPRGQLLTGSGISRVVSRTLPATLNTVVSEDHTYGNKVKCSRLLSELRGLDCHATYQHGYGLFTMLRENIESKDHLGFGSFDLSLREVRYDTDRYRLRYFVNLCEVPGEWGETAPWWSVLGGERPWIVPLSD
ncbi:MAG: hypothetical protein J6M23_08305 [Bacteroidales bacterium]|nr:hypothetical protein [Bacteroidales bacterium]